MSGIVAHYYYSIVAVTPLLLLQVRSVRDEGERDGRPQSRHEHPGVSTELGQSVDRIQLRHGEIDVYYLL